MRAQLFFDRYRLDRSQGLLWRGAERVALKPKALALLDYLASHSGRLLTKRELLDAVWPDVHVTEAVLKVNVRELRAALGDVARPPRLIETAHRRGYRFAAAVRTHSLPTGLTRFVGRGEALARVERSLAGARLVTLVGAGGVGKTRLALEAAGRLRDELPEGVWLVDLAPLADPEGVAAAVARALGVHEPSGESLVDALVASLAERRLILLLDNCERARSAVSRLAAELLRRAAGVSVLATSRQALGVPGEVVLQLAPLSLPEPGARTPEAVLSSEAGQLFVERAAAAAPSFRFDAETAPAVTEICRRAEGLPLAIELAAARARGLGVGELARRLAVSPLLLEAPEGAQEPRHRSLDAVLAWSLELLRPSERVLFARLGVFAGAFTLAAARDICGADGPLGARDVEEGVQALVAHSLLEASPEGDDLRYRMLEPIRRLASARLAASPLGASLARRHSAWWCDLAERGERELAGGRRSSWLVALDGGLEDLRAALGWCLGPAGDRAVGLRLAGGLLWFWFHRALWGEGRRWLGAALEASAAADPADAGRALHGLGLLEFFAGDYDAAVARLERALALREAAGERVGAGLSRSFLGAVELARGDRRRARALSEQALAQLRGREAPWALGLALVNLGNALRDDGDLDAARELYGEAASLFRELPDDWALAMALRNLGIVALRAGDRELAARRLRESLAELRRSGELWFVSRGLEELAPALLEGEPRRAARLLGAAERLRERVGAPVVSLYRAGYERARETLAERLGAAGLAEAWREGRELSLEAALAEALRPDAPVPPAARPGRRTRGKPVRRRR